MKTYIGKVVSTKMNNAVVVERSIDHQHPLYKKIIRREHRMKAMSDMDVKVGDIVKITETRPVSKDIHFKVVEKI